MNKCTKFDFQWTAHLKKKNPLKTPEKYYLKKLLIEIKCMHIEE